MGAFATPVSYFGTFYIEHVCKREVKMMLRRTKRPYMRARVFYFGTFYIEHVFKSEVKMMLRRTKRPYMRAREKTEFENELKFKNRQCYNTYKLYLCKKA